ncbi:uncharacterized protein LOC110628801 isoform X2 [Manihot esculenta]|uniref:Uncharacterized protein n=1 Tax=Manihot esculenta TaxID=3983 RepID=A0ACB7GPF0_MANES|nr:uncharacterized protein LOC110628801 isoform X2 [Manihot esculenta]KAG8641835.1 hypothetical protein MANES_12G036500v8 [Manihot esculenta]
MYPRVRVRKQEQEDDTESEIFPLEINGDSKFLKVLESLSVLACFSPEKENQSDSPALIARITQPYVPNLTTEPVSASKENNKVHGKAQLISRPRAVLSSPANDGMFGSRKKANNEKSLALRKCNSEPRKPIQFQTKAKASASESSQAKAKAESSPNMRRGSSKGISRIGSSKFHVQKPS